MNNFIEIYDKSVDDEYCDSLIGYFENLRNRGHILSRQKTEGVSKIAKDTNTFYSDNAIAFEKTSNILNKFCEALQGCYFQYVDKYGVLSSLSQHSISESIKIQKTSPGQGYHVWHCEHANILSGRRLLLVILYLNHVDEGGETEFLYQHLRISPKKGTMLICPANFSHTHRGNPPLKNDKYVVSTWIEFSE